MDILLLQANWGKKPRRMRKVMTANAKRKRFGKMIRRCRLHVAPRDGPKTNSHALEDIGASIVVQELLDLSRVNRGTG